MLNRFIAILALVFSTVCPAQTLEDRVNQQFEAFYTILGQQAELEAVPSDRVSRLVEKLQLKSVNFYVVQNSPFGMGASVKNTVLLDASLLSESDELLAYVIAHEYSHFAAQHWKQVIGNALSLANTKGITAADDVSRLVTEATNGALSHRHEFEADAFAKKILEKHNLWNPAAAKKALTVMVDAAASDTHPSADARLRAMGVE